jgi:hypothetical protein
MFGKNLLIISVRFNAELVIAYQISLCHTQKLANIQKYYEKNTNLTSQRLTIEDF